MPGDLKGQKVLVTGANGFIGAHLTAALMRKGAVVHAMVRPGSSTGRLTQLDAAPQVLRADLTDHAGVVRAVQTIRPEVVFNLAVCRQGDDWARLLATNLNGAMNLISACGKVGARRFVSIGSSLEHFDPEIMPAPNLYGASRAAAALMLKQYAAERDIPLAHLRTYYVYGPLQGENKLIPTALRHALKGGPMPLTPSQSRRDFVHVSDIVSACIRAASIDEPRQLSVDIATGSQWSAQELVAMLADLMGAEIRTVTDATQIRAWERPDDRPDTRRAQRVMGWSAQMDLRNGLLDLVEKGGQASAA